MLTARLLISCLCSHVAADDFLQLQAELKAPEAASVRAAQLQTILTLQVSQMRN